MYKLQRDITPQFARQSRNQEFAMGGSFGCWKQPQTILTGLHLD